MSEISIQDQIDKINGFAKGYRATHVIDVGMQFGILEALAQIPEGMTVRQLALRLMLYEPYLKIWCQTAYHFEILDADEKEGFRLQPFLDEILGLGMSWSQYPTRPEPDENWRKGQEYESPLFSFIRSGRTVQTSKTPDASFATYKGTVHLPTIFSSLIFPSHKDIRDQLEKGVGFLDIGCGSANLIIEFARCFENSVFKGVDPDYYGIESAERTVAELGLGDRVNVEDMAGEEMDFCEEFEMAGMILTLHEILPEVRSDALSRAYRALTRGGHLLILDYPYPDRLEEFRNPVYTYGIIEQYFEAVNGIVHLSGKQQDRLLRETGFKDIQRRRVADDRFDFIIALK
jgi:ubiquinone/menaquinone biosynthesis C-methylase UbiE